jgi:hypothetical protein
MKKTALIIVCALATTGAAFAQGFYTFNQGAGQLVTTNNATSAQFGGSGAELGALQAAGTEVSAGNQYIFAVLDQSYSGTLSSDTNVWDGTWAYSGITATNKTSGQPGTLVSQSNFQAPNNGSTWNAGTSTNQYILVGWSVNMGTTWAGVSNILASGTETAGEYFGVSSVGFTALDTISPGYTLFGAANAAGNPINSPFTLFQLAPVPEPGTLALAGLGGISMLLFRRRNSKS